MTTQYDISTGMRAEAHRCSTKEGRRNRPGSGLDKLFAQALRLTKIAGAAALLAGALLIAPAGAQQSVFGRGDAVVTGFSGIKPADVPIAPGGNPLDEFFIDLDGVSAQIVSLATFGQPPQGQLVAAPSKLQIRARQLGQVFAIALDDGSAASLAPNIYLGATSAYGLQIVLPDSDGDGAPERVKKGHPNAQWMAGQFGLDAGGGPGAIWRVDGQTGAVSLFTTLPGNSGAGVGDVVFDRRSRQFFASDLDSGLIHRIGETGLVLDSFDHGSSGRPQKGLAAVNDDGSQLDIKNPAFDTLDPGTWGFTADERRVHGMAVQNGRLYYAVAGQVWSIGVSQAGFSGDARWEFDADDLPGDGPVTDMLFDKQGRIYLAQRGAQRASYDYSVFAEAEKSNVARYRREEPDNPATESVWVEEPEAYAIGIPPEHHQAEGGIALGYGHDANGALRGGACGEMLWSTGHRLRPGTDDPEAAEADVHGLQGNDIALVRPQNTPPQQSYFADYDSLFGDAAKSGHVGDVEIWQPCEGYMAPSFGQLPPGILPPGDVPPELQPEFTPEYEFETNLRLTKRARPKICSPYFGGWLCQYTVRVTNTGPDDYFGPIMVRDWLPGAPAGAVMGFAPTPPWNCWSVGASDHRCVRFGTYLAPGWSVDLTAYAWVPKSYDKCHLTNAARIEWAPPGSQWNSNPFDDMDFAVATIPADHCKPGDRSDLTIYKVAAGNCYPFAGKLRCPYVVGVQNLGPAPYNGVIEVEDTVPAGTTAVFAGAPWVPAGPVGNTYTLTHPGANLASSAFAPLFAVGIDVPFALAKQMNCKVENKVKITQAPGGSPQNFNAANDTASAVAMIPAKYCKQGEQTDLKIYKDPLGACFPHNGKLRCGYRIRVVNQGPGPYNGNIVVKDTIPNGTTAIFSGPAGWDACPAMGNVHNCTYAGASLPNPSDEISLTVRIDLTKTRAQELGCKVRNRAEITFAPGGSSQNTDPTNDQASAVAIVPEQYCGDPPVSNLKLVKIAPANATCLVNKDWCRVFRIKVTNTGPDSFNGKIKVTDIAPAGVTVGIVAPGWNCMGTTCETNAAVTLDKNPPSGDEKAFTVIMEGTAEDARKMNCKLTNKAKIDSPLGAPKNTNAADDQDQITVDLPEKFCVTPVPQSNLKIKKTLSRVASIEPCNADWCESFVIMVTNTSPNQFNDYIAVADIIPDGVGFKIGGNDWNCVFAGCETTKPVKLDKDPPSGDGVVLKVTLSGTAAQAKAMNCKLTNKAQITSPLGAPKNVNAADDEDQVTVDLPKKFCETSVPQTNLKLEKSVSEKGCTRGDNFECHYTIKVTNTGPGDYNDKIVVNEFIPIGTSVTGDWNCGIGSCTHDPVLLKPGASVVLNVKVIVPYGLAKELKCKVTNGAKITYAPGGSASNTNPNDDTDTATATIPAEFCKNETDAPQCPPGFAWNGERCDRPDPVCKRGETRIPGTNRCCPPGEPWNPRLRQCGGDTPPPQVCPNGGTPIPGTDRCCPPGEWNPRTRQCGGDTPPPQQCEPGWTPIPGTSRCCPPGKPWTGQQCGRDVPPSQECPPGTKGDYPKCVVIETPRCPNGWSGQPPVCCPPPSRFVNGQCVTRPDTDDTPDCRKGQILSNGHCCPRGTVWNGQSCSRTPNSQEECPSGTTGRPPRCKPIVKECPQGTVGTPPNCRKEPPRECPRGTVGKFPVCKPVIKDCPRGTVGTPPNCRKIEPPRQCPPGTVGRFPSCRPVVRVCPPGMVGQPPNCRRINLNPQGGGSLRPRIDLPGPRFQLPRPGGASRGFNTRSGGGGQSPLR